jgi:hypothetical protein
VTVGFGARTQKRTSHSTTAPRTACLRGPLRDRHVFRVLVEREVRVRVKHHAVRAREESGPGVEAVVDVDVGPVACVETRDRANDGLCLEIAA